MRQEKGKKRHRNRQRKPGWRKLHTQERREWPKSVQWQTEVRQKLIQILDKWAQLNHSQGTRGVHDKHLPDGLR